LIPYLLLEAGALWGEGQVEGLALTFKVLGKLPFCPTEDFRNGVRARRTRRREGSTWGGGIKDQGQKGLLRCEKANGAKLSRKVGPEFH
jgi:hypothetical protein